MEADLVRKSRAFLVLVKCKNKKLSLQKKARKSPTFWMQDLVCKSRAFGCEREVIWSKQCSLRKSPTFWMVDLVCKSWAFVYKHTIEKGEKES